MRLLQFASLTLFLLIAWSAPATAQVRQGHSVRAEELTTGREYFWGSPGEVELEAVLFFNWDSEESIELFEALGDALDGRTSHRVRLVLRNVATSPEAKRRAANALGALCSKDSESFFDYLSAGLARIPLVQSDEDPCEIKDRVSADTKLAERLGVTAAPTVFLNGLRIPFENSNGLASASSKMIKERIHFSNRPRMDLVERNLKRRYEGAEWTSRTFHMRARRFSGVRRIRSVSPGRLDIFSANGSVGANGAYSPGAAERPVSLGLGVDGSVLGWGRRSGSLFAVSERVQMGLRLGAGSHVFSGTVNGAYLWGAQLRLGDPSRAIFARAGASFDVSGEGLGPRPAQFKNSLVYLPQAEAGFQWMRRHFDDWKISLFELAAHGGFARQDLVIEGQGAGAFDVAYGGRVDWVTNWAQLRLQYDRTPSFDELETTLQIQLAGDYAVTLGARSPSLTHMEEGALDDRSWAGHLGFSYRRARTR